MVDRDVSGFERFSSELCLSIRFLISCRFATIAGVNIGAGRFLF